MTDGSDAFTWTTHRHTWQLRVLLLIDRYPQMTDGSDAFTWTTHKRRCKDLSTGEMSVLSMSMRFMGDRIINAMEIVHRTVWVNVVVVQSCSSAVWNEWTEKEDELTVLKSRSRQLKQRINTKQFWKTKTENNLVQIPVSDNSLEIQMFFESQAVTGRTSTTCRTNGALRLCCLSTAVGDSGTSQTVGDFDRIFA